MTKTCSSCRSVLPVEDFTKDKSKRDGLNSSCRSCNNARAKKWREENREAWLLHGRRGHIKFKYGLELEEYEAMLFAQGGLCSICGDEPAKDYGFCVDHDHATGKVRGIICVHCNRGLGAFRDNTTYLASAIKYLEKYNV